MLKKDLAAIQLIARTHRGVAEHTNRPIVPALTASAVVNGSNNMEAARKCNRTNAFRQPKLAQKHRVETGRSLVASQDAVLRSINVHREAPARGHDSAWSRQLRSVVMARVRQPPFHITVTEARLQCDRWHVALGKKNEHHAIIQQTDVFGMMFLSDISALKWRRREVRNRYTQIVSPRGCTLTLTVNATREKLKTHAL